MKRYYTLPIVLSVIVGTCLLLRGLLDNNLSVLLKSILNCALIIGIPVTFMVFYILIDMSRRNIRKEINYIINNLSPYDPTDTRTSWVKKPITYEEWLYDKKINDAVKKIFEEREKSQHIRLINFMI